MDNTTMTKGRIAVMLMIWFGVLFVIWGAYKFMVRPYQKEVAAKQAQQEHQQIVEKTSAPSRFKYTVNFAADTFSGYAAIRSGLFRDENAKFGIKVELTDDGANYPQRLAKLASGELDMAVFTIDALMKSSAEYKDIPATVVAMVDETKGADAMVASKQKFPNIDALNSSGLKIVCTRDSPSETLARVVMAQFNLDKLPDNPFQFMDSVDQVYQEYQRTKPTDNKVFVLWEPYVSKILDNPDYHVLVDSSKFRGYIVDVIVARRGFLVQNEELVLNVVKSYLKSMFDSRNGMTKLVMDDAKFCGTPLKLEQAQKLAEKIWWKNTQENFSHFGLTAGQGMQHIEEMSANIMDVLSKTKAITVDPSGGRPNMWYYDGVMRKLFDTSWHPGFGPEEVRKEKALASLSDDEWKQLKPVGTLQVPRLVFARGGSKLSESSFATLDKLVESLKTWPQYYLLVQGNHSSGGDAEANKVLAESRAQSAVDYLISKGVDRSRIHAETSKPNGSTTVAFVLGELPY
jgi:ABC-type nitrate/sulfonate/bicarbonate transport system substrate-binding protein